MAALLYLASKKIPGLDKYKTCKLLFLCDSRHLVRYGRPITGDTYYALNWGPVPSSVLHALNDEDPLANDIANLCVVTRDKYRRYRLKKFKTVVAQAKKLIEDCLSQSDIETIDEIVANYGGKSFDELYKITHATPAYYKAWARRGDANSSIMLFDEFFEGDPQASQALLAELQAHASRVEAIEAQGAAIQSGES